MDQQVVLVDFVSISDGVVDCQANMLASDLENLQRLISFVCELKESHFQSVLKVNEFLRHNSIGCMSVPEVEKLACYILKISSSNIARGMERLYFQILLMDRGYPLGFKMTPAVYSMLPDCVKNALCVEVDAFITEHAHLTDSDKTLVKIRAEGLSNKAVAIEFTHRFNKVAKEVAFQYRREIAGQEIYWV